MHPLVARIRRTVRRFSLIPPGARVAVAISGGADSIVLLHVLRELDALGDARLAGVVHLNHCLRGDAADLDEDFCRRVAGEAGIPFDCERVDVAALAAARGISIEAAGHEARCALFERAAARLAAARVALGHTRDDQAETFLLRLLRGAGPRGLAGMHPRTGPLVRPMLECSRAQVRHFAERHGLAFREDASNGDLAIARNRVRHEVLPHLARVSPAITAILGREAEIARDDADFLDVTARAAFDRLARDHGDVIECDAESLRLLPTAIGRRVVAAAASRFAGGRAPGFEHVERVLDLIRQGAPARRRLNLPGQWVEFDGSCVLFSRGAGRQAARRPASGTEPLPARRHGEDANFLRFSLSIPGEVVSPLGWTVSAERAGEWDPGKTAAEAGAGGPYPRTWAVLDGAALAMPLTVRTWTPGDRFRPLGMTGTRKLQDFFVDRKVPRERRRDVPIVTDARGRIVWVAGHVIAEEFRVTPAAADVVILKLKYWRHGT